MTFTQKDPESLRRVRNVLGKAGVRVSGIDWTDDNRRGKATGHYRLRISRFEAVQAIVAMLWPWLSERRKVQAMTALAERGQ